jgi:hypothetical protein
MLVHSVSVEASIIYSVSSQEEHRFEVKTV